MDCTQRLKPSLCNNSNYFSRRLQLIPMLYLWAVSLKCNVSVLGVSIPIPSNQDYKPAPKHQKEEEIGAKLTDCRGHSACCLCHTELVTKTCRQKFRDHGGAVILHLCRYMLSCMKMEPFHRWRPKCSRFRNLCMTSQTLDSPYLP